MYWKELADDELKDIVGIERIFLNGLYKPLNENRYLDCIECVENQVGCFIDVVNFATKLLSVLNHHQPSNQESQHC